MSCHYHFMIIIVISYVYSAIYIMIKDRIGLTSLSPITIINCHFCIGNLKKLATCTFCL